MAGIIAITLKAVDQYSGVLTGLNQGFELVSKALGTIKAVADTAFTAIQDGVAIAAKGGTYAEMRRQFNNVATSFNADGQKILNDLDRITSGMISLPDAARLAGKGITAGLSDKQIEAAFTFVKRRTELTGESFNVMSEQIFTALQSGRFSTLRQMGLVVESGAKIEDVMKAMTVATKQYGDAGYNAADSLSTLSNQQDKFTTALGVAINETPLFQKALLAIASTIVQLVELFDPRPLSVFFDVFGKLFISLVKSAAAAIPGIDSVFKFIGDILNGTADDAGAVVLSISRSLFSITRTVATVANDVLDILTDTGILTFVEFLMSTIISTISIGGKIIFATVGNIAAGVINALEIAITGISELVRGSPTLSDWLGIDPQDLAGVEVALAKASRGIESFTNKIVDGFDVGQEFADNLNAGLAETLRRGRFDLTAIDDAEQEMSKRISEIDFSKSWGESLTPKAGDAAAGLQDVIANLEKTAAQGIEEIKIPVDLGIDKKITDEFEKGLRDTDKIIKNAAKDATINLAPDDKMRSIADYVLEKVGATNWPAAMQQMMQAMLAMLVAAVVDEPMPIAITNFRPV